MNQLSRRLAGVIATGLCLTLTGCGGGGGGGGGSSGGDDGSKGNTGNATVKTRAVFDISSFTAQYSSEDDGTTPGVGNDGSDPDITPILVAQEQTDHIAINYSNDDLDGISSYNFYGVWEGEITVYQAGTIDINFDFSAADIHFNMADVTSQQWINDNRTLRVTVNEGSHAVKAEFHNHWYTTNLNISLTRYTPLTVATAGDTLAPLISETTKIVYVGADVSSDLYHKLTIQLPEYSGDVLLFVSSYHSMNIVIDNPYNTAIAGVVVNSAIPDSTVSGQGDASIFKVSDFDFGFDDLSAPHAEIVTMTGREPNFEFGQYAVDQVVVPVF